MMWHLLFLQVTLTINLIDINDVAPVFTSQFGYVFSVSEDVSIIDTNV